ncbi:MAG: NAD(P)H-quinone oxidoreductase [Rickettsiales bacterium]
MPGNTLNIPAHMQAVRIETPGKETGRLITATVPTPAPAPHEVLIKIAAAGVNRADIFQKQGSYPPPEGASELPGLEVAGTIAAIGNAVDGWCVGDAVCALLPGGGYAEFAVAHGEHLLPLPQGWSMEEGAGLPEALFTVWMALREEARLKAGESVLIHGGASGIGMMAIAYAAQLGAKVYTTASTREKCRACEKAGANTAISYRDHDFVAVMQDILPEGVDVVLDMVGGDYIARNFNVLKTDGRMISIAFLRGAKPEGLSLAPLLLKRLSWKGATLRSRSDHIKAAYAQHIQAQLGTALDKGRLKPTIDSTFSLEDAEKAHLRMEQNLNIGKIVLQL